MEYRKIVFNMLIDEITETLSKYGFKKISKRINSGKGVWQLWERNLLWKVDSVRIIYSKEYSNVYADVTVYFDNIAEERIRLDGANVAYHVREKTSRYSLPKRELLGFLKNIRASRAINLIVNDIEEALKWFELYDEPQKCIDRIVEDRTSVHKGGLSYGKALEHLKTVKMDKE